MKRGRLSRLVSSNLSSPRKARIALRAISAAATLAGMQQVAHAQNLWWDLNGTSAGAGGAGAGSILTGAWDNTATNWNTDAAGGNAGAVSAWPAAPGGTANFSAGGAGTGAFTVTVSGTQNIGGLNIEEGSVTISGGTLL